MVTPEELCPGVRKGGWCNRVMPEILCICPSHTIPKSFIIDLSRLEVGDK
jgi:large subunit ribosomal protein L25